MPAKTSLKGTPTKKNSTEIPAISAEKQNVLLNTHFKETEKNSTETAKYFLKNYDLPFFLNDIMDYQNRQLDNLKYDFMYFIEKKQTNVVTYLFKQLNDLDACNKDKLTEIFASALCISIYKRDYDIFRITLSEMDNYDICKEEILETEVEFNREKNSKCVTICELIFLNGNFEFHFEYFKDLVKYGAISMEICNDDICYLLSDCIYKDEKIFVKYILETFDICYDEMKKYFDHNIEIGDDKLNKTFLKNQKNIKNYLNKKGRR
jgi:hypothetical protein